MKTYKYLNVEETQVGVIDEDGLMRVQTVPDRVPEGEVIAPYAPPTQAEIDAAQQAEIDALTNQLDTGRSIIRALGVEVYLLASAADPSLNPAKFKQRIRDRIAGF